MDIVFVYDKLYSYTINCIYIANGLKNKTPNLSRPAVTVRRCGVKYLIGFKRETIGSWNGRTVEQGFSMTSNSTCISRRPVALYERTTCVLLLLFNIVVTVGEQDVLRDPSVAVTVNGDEPIFFAVPCATRRPDTVVLSREQSLTL